MATTIASPTTSLTYTNRAAQLFEPADVRINGGRPWDLQIADPEPLFKGVFSRGTLHFCEAYLAGGWKCDDIPGMCKRIFEAHLESEFGGWSDWWLVAKSAVANLQSIVRSRRVGTRHYDLGNEFYSLWLDRSMTYSCARWPGVTTLEEAQKQKIDLICRKLHLKGGERILEIGCGWGSLAKHLAENYDARVVGLTISHEQGKYAKEACRDLPVEIRVEDYRETELAGDSFDHVVSIAMLEAVGTRNYRPYMEFAASKVRPGGLFLCHSIVGDPSSSNPYMDKYIFPGGQLGATWQIEQAAEELFVHEDWENFGPDYSRTLQAWDERFLARWDDIEPLVPESAIRLFGSKERFKRGWHLYLTSFDGGFQSRRISVGQEVFAKGGVPGGYVPVRL